MRFNPADREWMTRQRELWMVETLGLSAERAERYAVKMPPVWAHNLPYVRLFLLVCFVRLPAWAVCLSVCLSVCSVYLGCLSLSMDSPWSPPLAVRLTPEL